MANWLQNKTKADVISHVVPKKVVSRLYSYIFMHKIVIIVIIYSN